MTDTNEQHDDGLVHGHAWASEPPPSIGEMLRPMTDTRRARAEAAAKPASEHGHDDGLVHHHGWACGERGAMGFHS